MTARTAEVIDHLGEVIDHLRALIDVDGALIAEDAVGIGVARLMVVDQGPRTRNQWLAISEVHRTGRHSRGTNGSLGALAAGLGRAAEDRGVVGWSSYGLSSSLAARCGRVARAAGFAIDRVGSEAAAVVAAGAEPDWNTTGALNSPATGTNAPVVVTRDTGSAGAGATIVDFAAAELRASISWLASVWRASFHVMGIPIARTTAARST